MIDAYLEEIRSELGDAAGDADTQLDSLRQLLVVAEADGRLPVVLEQFGRPGDVAARMVARGALHRHLDPVELPGGGIVWAATFQRDGYVREAPPDFGLYLDANWAPPWPHIRLDWPDFGVPEDDAELRAALAGLLQRAHSGEVVEVGCLGGHGRTGTALACVAVLAGLDTDPVAWVRSAYCEHAVETEEQARFARSFAGAGRAD